jgi:hypothetical protein
MVRVDACQCQCLARSRQYGLDLDPSQPALWWSGAERIGLQQARWRLTLPVRPRRLGSPRSRTRAAVPARRRTRPMRPSTLAPTIAAC